ncbi:MAG TPA: peptide chain release factor N(5)-glutamine methyltransferase [Tepidisphaeraceae bacterium]|jgi:release factor glutamine methyltransferase
MSEAVPWTIRRLLEWTAPFFTRKEVDSPRLSAELLLAHVLQVPRIKLYTDYDRVLSEKELIQFRELVKRAGEQEPIAYLTGTAHFFNLEFAVTPDVLIPRPETETLVEHILQLARHETGLSSPRILDLCTGSGCIAAALAQNLKTAVVIATDISEKALAVAKQNLQKLQLDQRVTLAQGDLFSALDNLPDARNFDLIVSNPPYIPAADIEKLDKSVRDFEPRLALDGGLDGLSSHRRILSEAPKYLAPGGRIYLEIAYDQGPAVLEIARQYPEFESPKILKDLGPRDRILTAQLRKL